MSFIIKHSVIPLFLAGNVGLSKLLVWVYLSATLPVWSLWPAMAAMTAIQFTVDIVVLKRLGWL